MSNALIPAGFILMYKYGFSVESVIGCVFVVIGIVGWIIYRQKMSIPLVEHDGQYLVYRPSASSPGEVKMDESAQITVRELGLTALNTGVPESKIEISRLDFDSNEDWLLLISNLRKEPHITLLFET